MLSVYELLDAMLSCLVRSFVGMSGTNNSICNQVLDTVVLLVYCN